MTHAILIEFEPSKLSPLHIICTIENKLHDLLEDEAIKEYNISIPQIPKDGLTVMELIAIIDDRRRCPDCKSTDLVKDDNDLVCRNCGKVIRA